MCTGGGHTVPSGKTGLMWFDMVCVLGCGALLQTPNGPIFGWQCAGAVEWGQGATADPSLVSTLCAPAVTTSSSENDEEGVTFLHLKLVLNEGKGKGLRSVYMGVLRVMFAALSLGFGVDTMAGDGP